MLHEARTQAYHGQHVATTWKVAGIRATSPTKETRYATLEHCILSPEKKNKKTNKQTQQNSNESDESEVCVQTRPTCTPATWVYLSVRTCDVVLRLPPTICMCLLFSALRSYLSIMFRPCYFLRSIIIRPLYIRRLLCISAISGRTVNERRVGPSGCYVGHTKPANEPLPSYSCMLYTRTPRIYALLPCGHFDFESAATAQNDEFKGSISCLYSRS